MFIIDFDDTLFNTSPGFKDARMAAVRPLGVSEADYKAAYDIVRQGPGGNGYYSITRHAEELGKLGFDRQKIKAALQTLMTPEKLREFLFPDAVPFLEGIKAFGEPMVLLSLGDEEFQNAKVEGVGIKEYFDRMFFVSDTKEHVVRHLLESVSDKIVWFVNDRVSDLANWHELLAPRLRVVLKQAPACDPADYPKSGLPYFKTLTEIYDYIVANR